MPGDMSPCELSGKTAVVTGGSGAIGRAIVIELARAGADVLVHTGSQKLAADEVAQQVRQLKHAAHVIVCDLRHPETHHPFVDEAWHWRSRVDIWMNIAGADVLTGNAAKASFDEKIE